ncbi:MAG: class I SAM-dependent methyltransferase [Oscillospiraceae bacterium]|nr:class I SAM-dependent methyltransferase [Oscillospiraceae bacterium]
MKIDDAVIVKEYYNADPQKEWERLANWRFEFRIAAHYMERYIKPGQSVLDIGGGTGRYSLWLAHKGCDVTLFDLSEKSIEFAQRKAAEYGVSFKTVVGDARYITANPKLAKKYDHVLIMGPLYHLTDEYDRASSLRGAVTHLKKGGKLFASFVSIIGGMVFMLRECPELVTNQSEQPYINALMNGHSYGGDAFTRAFFSYPDEILPFMENFPLQKLHFLGQEGISSPFFNRMMPIPQPAIDKWFEISLALCEKDEFLSYSEHLMYIGEKI